VRYSLLVDSAVAALLHRYSVAFVADHEQAAIDCYTDDVVLRFPGRHRFTGEFRGRPAVVEALQALATATGGTIGAREVRNATFSPSSAMVHVLMGAQSGGNTADWQRVIVYRFSGERISEMTFHDFDTRAMEKLLG
jgi:ketosteroid isomerase-like protein